MLTEQNKTKHRAYFFHSASHTAAGTVALQKPKGTIAKSRAIALLPLNNALIFVSSCPLVGTQARSLLVSQRHISTTLPYNIRHSLKRYVHLFHTFSLFRLFFFFLHTQSQVFHPIQSQNTAVYSRSPSDSKFTPPCSKQPLSSSQNFGCCRPPWLRAEHFALVYATAALDVGKTIQSYLVHRCFTLKTLALKRVNTPGP